jgi:DNA-binding LytR/AlgR family response regulator
MSERIVILIVDDELHIIRAMQRTLRNLGYEILASTNPKDAMNILENAKPDIIICDYNMPDMNGIDVLKYAKKVLPDSFRVLMTGYTDVNIAIAAINEGSIFYYITKPWKNDELTTMLQNIADQKQHQKAQSSLIHILKDNGRYLSEVVDKIKAIDKVPEYDDQKIPLLEDDTIVLINSTDILYLSAMEGDVIIFTVNGKYKSHESLNSWGDKLGKSSFFRCHRSYIVNTKKIEKISPWFNGAYTLKLKDCKDSIPVSRENMKYLRSMFGI